jgi:hypothetical protein
VGLALGVWILAGTFGPTMAAAPAAGGAVKEVRANRFVVEDENGKDRAVLSTTKDGPMLGLYDEKGKFRVGLGVNTGGSMLELSDENGKKRAMLAMTEDGPGMNLFDENGKGGAGLNLTKDGPGLGMLDEKGEVRVLLEAKKDGSSMSLYDDNGKKRAGLFALTVGPGMHLWDENGKRSVGLGMSKNSMALNLRDENGKSRVMLGMVKNGEPILAFLDEAGREVSPTANATPSPRPARPTLADVPPVPVQKRPQPLWTKEELGQQHIPMEERKQAAPAVPSRVEPTAPQWRPCPSCNGSGTTSLNCFMCKGTGTIGNSACPSCKGRRFNSCLRCNGKGMVSD